MNAVRPIDTILVLGGTSEIGVAAAAALVRRGATTVILAGRSLDAMATPAQALRDAGARTVDLVEFDGDRLDTHRAFVGRVFEKHGDIDLVLVAWGVLGDNNVSQTDENAAVSVIRTNFEGAVSVAIPVVERLKAQGRGHLAVLSSVAAERPRKDNFVYGASKAGMDAFFQGLADTLQGTGVHVMVVRPGRVRTKMTTGMPEVPFTVDPDAVANAIVRGLDRGATTVYAPGIMRVVMSGLRHLPRPLFRRVSA